MTVARDSNDSTAVTTSTRRLVPLRGGCRTPRVHPYKLKSVTYAVLRAPEVSSISSAGAIKRTLRARRRSRSIVSNSDRPGAGQENLLVSLCRVNSIMLGNRPGPSKMHVRNYCRNLRATLAGFDFQAATELFHSFFHSHDSDT